MRILTAIVLALTLSGCSIGLTPSLDVGFGGGGYYNPGYYHPRPYWGGGWGHHHYWR